MKKAKIIIAIVISLLAMLLLANHCWDDTQSDTPEEATLTEEVIPLKKEVDVTENVITKDIKKNKNKANNFNIKTNKDEIISYAKGQVINQWGEEHWEAFYNIVKNESGWNPNLINKKSGACGLFQMYPCKKTSKDYKTSYKAQIKAGINYILGRYGNPINAWSFWQQHKWY